jgi:hypothetical protein
VRIYKLPKPRKLDLETSLFSTQYEEQEKELEFHKHCWNLLDPSGGCVQNGKQQSKYIPGALSMQ